MGRVSVDDEWWWLLDCGGINRQSGPYVEGLIYFVESLLSVVCSSHETFALLDGTRTRDMPFVSRVYDEHDTRTRGCAFLLLKQGVPHVDRKAATWPETL
jgi:hypothetical protein